MGIKKNSNRSFEPNGGARKKRKTYSVDPAVISNNVDSESNKTVSKFANRFNELLEKKGIDQLKVAQDTKLTMASISNYRNGKVEPKITALHKIAKYLNVSADYLLGLTDVRTPNVKTKALCGFLGLTEKSIETLIKNKNNKNTSLDYLILSHLLDDDYISGLTNVIKFDLIYYIYEKYSQIKTDEDWAFSMAIRDENEEMKFGFSSKFISGIYKSRETLLESVSPQLKDKIIMEMTQLKQDKIKGARKDRANAQIKKNYKKNNEKRG